MHHGRLLVVRLCIAVVLGDEPTKAPIPVLDPNPEFLPRAVTYLSHMFPLRDDTTSFTFGKDEKREVREELFDLSKLTVLLVKGKEETSKSGYDAALYQCPFWRNIPTHLHVNKFLDIERIATFHKANPALQHAVYNKERCEYGDFQDFKSTRIIQTYIEPGFPFEIPCYSCLRNQTGFTTVFYLIPSRNFLTNIELHEMAEAFDDKPNVAVPMITWLLHQIKNHQKSDESKHEAQLVFGLGRDAGGHTSMDTQSFLGDGTGRLQVNVASNHVVINLPLKSGIEKERQLVYEKFYGGLTLTCAQLVDNEPRSLGFIHNIDYLFNINSEDKFFKNSINYEHYELLSNPSSLPYKATKYNIKIDISWEQWSCCSACCCSVALCGLYSNEKKCHEVDSYRTRRGFLSLFLLDMEKKLSLGDKAVSEELDKVLRVSPYREKGIAIFSSFILRNPRFMEHLWDNTLKPPASVEELISVDPCGDLPMVTLSISESSSSFRFEPNISYRLRLDGLDMETIKSITWKVGGDIVPPYDPSKLCDEQSIAVHANGADLIIIDVNATKVLGNVVEAFTGKHRFRIHFLEDSPEDTYTSDHRATIQTAGIVGGCASAVLALITIMHKYKWRQKSYIGTEKSRRKTERTSRRTRRALRKRLKEKAVLPAEKAQAVAV
ncbi:hypothetical protein RB195_005624 [Necator americanus]|uniref:Uncharacterized protein n=1 Tax=Necator americanus TaxID=51031 RepID=A0ABR1BSP9_NECAM